MQKVRRNRMKVHVEGALNQDVGVWKVRTKRDVGVCACLCGQARLGTGPRAAARVPTPPPCFASLHKQAHSPTSEATVVCSVFVE